MFKNLLISLVIFIIIASVAVALGFLTPKTEIAPEKIAAPSTYIKPETSLSFSSNEITVKKGQATEIEILINTKGMSPTLAQLELAYDPFVFSQISLSPSDFFPNPNILLEQIDEKNGRISYALGLPLDKKGSNYEGSLAKLKFTISKSTTLTQTSLNFLPKTEILSQKTNIPLKVAYGLKILINRDSPAASSSASLKP